MHLDSYTCFSVVISCDKLCFAFRCTFVVLAILRSNILLATVYNIAVVFKFYITLYFTFARF